MLRFISLIILSCTLIACATPTITVVKKTQGYSSNGEFRSTVQTVRYSSTTETVYLEQGKKYFEGGYYKSAMHKLLPLAVDGNPEAQYAVGYMYYYGYGVTQDTDLACFWILRSAKQNFPPAMAARQMIARPVTQ